VRKEDRRMKKSEGRGSNEDKGWGEGIERREQGMGEEEKREKGNHMQGGHRMKESNMKRDVD
jgi:hypothetical protein